MIRANTSQLTFLFYCHVDVGPVMQKLMSKMMGGGAGMPGGMEGMPGGMGGMGGAPPASGGGGDDDIPDLGDLPDLD